MGSVPLYFCTHFVPSLLSALGLVQYHNKEDTMKTILLLVFFLNIFHTRPDLRDNRLGLKTNSEVKKYKLEELWASDLSKTLQNIDLKLGRSSDWVKLEDHQDIVNSHREKRSPKKKDGKKSSKKCKQSKKAKEKKSKESSSEEESCESGSEEMTTTATTLIETTTT